MEQFGPMKSLSCSRVTQYIFIRGACCSGWLVAEVSNVVVIAQVYVLVYLLLETEQTLERGSLRVDSSQETCITSSATATPKTTTSNLNP